MWTVWPDFEPGSRLLAISGSKLVWFSPNCRPIPGRQVRDVTAWNVFRPIRVRLFEKVGIKQEDKQEACVRIVRAQIPYGRIRPIRQCELLGDELKTIVSPESASQAEGVKRLEICQESASDRICEPGIIFRGDFMLVYASFAWKLNITLNEVDL